MSHPDQDRPCVVLLLPQRLEAFEHRALVEPLLGTDGVVVVEPPPVSYARQARWPEAFGVMVAQRQAKRLRKALPAPAAAVAIFHPSQYRLGRTIVATQTGCELFYGDLDDAPDGRLGVLHHLAKERAEVVFDASGDELRIAVLAALD